MIAVPDSGNRPPRGYSRASGIPQDDGLIKNRYVGRTFIQPGQELRKHGLRLKFNPMPEVVGGKRLVVVDDSIVRGNTTRQIVQMLRDAGAAEIHMRITAPPIRHPCHYGIDMSTREEMVAHGRTVEEIATELGCDSLAYLSLDGVYEAIGSTRDHPLRRLLHGEYPLAGTAGANGKFALEQALPARAAERVRGEHRARAGRSWAHRPRPVAALWSRAHGPRRGPARATSASPLPARPARGGARPRSAGATCSWSCPRARASRCVTSCRR